MAAAALAAGLFMTSLSALAGEPKPGPDEAGLRELLDSREMLEELDSLEMLDLLRDYETLTEEAYDEKDDDGSGAGIDGADGRGRLVGR